MWLNNWKVQGLIGQTEIWLVNYWKVVGQTKYDWLLLKRGCRFENLSSFFFLGGLFFLFVLKVGGVLFVVHMSSGSVFVLVTI